MSKSNPNSTVLIDFQRSIRNEPFFYIYKVKIFVATNEISPVEVNAWLRDRYVNKPRSHRYRVAAFTGTDDVRYVDYILMESCTDEDLVYIKIRWGYSFTKIARGNRIVRKRLNSIQKACLDTLIKKTRDDFFDSLS